MEAVASQLIWDIIETGPDKWKSITRLTPIQTYERVINRRQSVAMSSIPAYVWGKLFFDRGEEETDEKDFFGSPVMRQYCELQADMDLGTYQQGLWLTDPRSGSTRNIRYNVVADEVAQSGAFGQLFGCSGYLHSEEVLFGKLIKLGIRDNQQFLMRIVADWSTDYWGESDLSWHQDFIYADPAEVTEDWLEWLLEEAAETRRRVEERQRQDAERAERQDARKFIDNIATGKGKSKLKLAGTQAHADAVEKKKKPGIFGR